MLLNSNLFFLCIFRTDIIINVIVSQIKLQMFFFIETANQTPYFRILKQGVVRFSNVISTLSNI